MRWWVAALAAFAALFIAAGAHAGTLFGEVIGVTDGDTITLLVDGRQQVAVRIAGIDAPEKRQAFGMAAKTAMSDCAYGKQAKVEWRKLDRYRRTVGRLVVDGIDCGLRQIERGLAWHYKAYAREQTATDRTGYAEAEDAARRGRKGLWSDTTPMPPWDFRHEGPAQSAGRPKPCGQGCDASNAW